MNLKQKNSIIIICVLILSIATRVYASETDTFTGNIGAWLRQSIWIGLATEFENSLMKTDNETVFYNLNEEINSDLVSQPSASSLTLYCKTSGAIQNFSITDIGTSEELIWYGCNTSGSMDKFIAKAYKNATTSSSGTMLANIELKYGGHQNFTVIKSGGYYRIYTGSYGNHLDSSGYYRPYGMAVTSIGTDSVQSTLAETKKYYSEAFDLEEEGLNVGAIIYASGVNETQTTMVTITSGRGAVVYDLNSTDIAKSEEISHFSVNIGDVSNQGICVNGNYLYILGRSYCVRNENILLQHTNRKKRMGKYNRRILYCK